MRQEHEKKFIGTMKQQVRLLIFNYLKTTHGQEEIECVIVQLEELNKRRDNQTKSKDTNYSSSEMTEKSLVYEVFRKFDADGSNSIDSDELLVLLKEINIQMKDAELKKLMKVLDTGGSGEIDFEDFFTWFSRLAEEQRKRTTLKALRDGTLFAPDIYLGLKNMVLDVRARNLIVDMAVQRTEQDAMREFRISHPPILPCDMCNYCALTPTELHRHKLDKDLHVAHDRVHSEISSKFQVVESAFTGAQGRRLLAHRLLYSVDLGGMEARIKVACKEPYRPRLGDPAGHREEQLRRGMLVQGEDPTAGIRALPKQRLLHKQHYAPGASKNASYFQDVLVQLTHCRADGIDVVTTTAGSASADVTFVWKDFITTKAEIVGEFNGWQREELANDYATCRYCITKRLAPGRYRYHYYVDGLARVDEQASLIQEENGRFLNIILVSNPPVFESSIAKPEHISLRDAAIGDDGMWSFAKAVQPNDVIQSLELSYNFLSDEGLNKLSSCLPKMRSLHTVKLNGNGFGYIGCRCLVNALRDNAVIQTLELSRNNLGDDAAEELARLITYHRSLATLVVDSNYIGNDGAEHIGKAVESNRTLRHLSMCNNRIYPAGCERLCFFIRHNGSLWELRLDGNPLGPDGCKYVGDMLSENKTLRLISLATVDMTRSGSYHGVHSIAHAIRKNHALSTVILRCNGIEEDGILFLAHALAYNRSITELDLAGSALDTKWLEPDSYLKTQMMLRMPSIRTSLDRNKLAESNDANDVCKRYRAIPQIIDDTFDGIWTARHRWQAKKSKLEISIANEVATLAEKARLKSESLFVKEVEEAELKQLALFLGRSEGRRLMDALATMISKYVRALGAKRNDAETVLLVEKGHMAMISACWDTFGDNLLTHTSKAKVLAVLKALCVPCCEKDLLPLCNADDMVGLSKFIKFYKTSHLALCRANKLERLRLQTERLVDNTYSTMAKTLFLNNWIARVKKLAVRRFREIQDNVPVYVCDFCQTRFSSQKDKDRHDSEPKYHRRFALMTEVAESQMGFILKAKHQLTGTTLPAYYQLNSTLARRKDVAPQLFDSKGSSEGRPIGVVEPNTTVRVEDVFGDWMELRFENRTGWIRYIEPSGRHLLVPALSDRPGFWDGLDCWSRPVYYRAAADLPNQAEIKVRRQPLLEAELFDVIKKGMVIECHAKLGSWVQLRFKDCACCWALAESGGKDILVALPARVHDTIAPYMAAQSPSFVRPELLVPPEEEEPQSDDDSEVNGASPKPL